MWVVAKKRDWLTREQRLRVAEIAVRWLALLPEGSREAREFGCACTVIERYLVDGGPATMELHEGAGAEVVPLRVV
jgi:hypothetical protein